IQSYRLQLLDPSVLEEPAVLQRGKVAERAVGPAPIVIHPPVLDEPPSVSEGEKPMLVQALVSEPAVEALDEGVLNGLARLDEVQPHAPLLGPLVQHQAGELRSIVQHDLLRRLAALGDQPVEHLRHPRPWKRRVYLDRQRLASDGVDDAEEADAAAPGQSVANEVQAPELIRTNRGRQGQPGLSSHTLATSPAHR